MVVHLKIRELREARRMTQKELADGTGCSIEEIDQYEKMYRMPDLLTLIAMKQGLGCDTLDELISAEGKKIHCDVLSQKEDFYFMLSAVRYHYQQKYPEQIDVVHEICDTVGKLLKAEPYQGGGVIGVMKGWKDQIEEIESTQQSM